MFDVLVIGGGNAALCAALMAREAGASVLLLEASPREWRSGNSQHTRNLRCMHDAPQDVLVDAYSEEEFWQDLLKVTGGQTNENLARIAIRASVTCRPWMQKHGVRFQPPLSGALHVGRTNAFFMGQRPMDRGFIALLLLTSATGLALLAWRDTGAMALLLALHLGAVMALFVTLPYGKFAHGIYRSAALLKFAIEKRQPDRLKASTD